MSRLAEALLAGRFVVTAELNPPKGTDISAVLKAGEALRGVVDAVNVTDQHAAVLSASPLAVGHLLADRGLEVILQVTCRDRNRIALQSDMLGAALLGIENILCLTGDDVETGDQPEAKTVFDMDAIGLLRAAAGLVAGVDLAGHPLAGAPAFFLGAVVNPGAHDLDQELRRMEEKVKAGARFFQTQGVFDAAMFARFTEAARGFGVPILAGIIPLKSVSMARRLNQTVPGVEVPEALVQEMAAAQDRASAGVAIAARLVREVRGMCQGVHVMAMGWEERIPQLLHGAGLRDRQEPRG